MPSARRIGDLIFEAGKRRSTKNVSPQDVIPFLVEDHGFAHLAHDRVTLVEFGDQGVTKCVVHEPAERAVPL